MMKKIFLSMLALGLLFTSCSDDDDNSNVITVNGGTIFGGPFTFAVDGVADNVSGITLDGTQVGAASSWVITDNATDPEILGLPGDLTALEMVNFDEAGGGECLIWYLRHDGTLGGAAVGNKVSQLTGTFNLSNSITVTRIDAGMISGGPFNFTVDGTADMVSDITLDGNQFGSNSSWVITDNATDPEILGLPGDMTALEMVNFDGAGTGVCLIWYLRHDGTLSGAEVGSNVSDLTGTFDLSNSITVNRD